MIMMQHWRRPFLIVLALLGLSTSLWPPTAWACPMTGRFGPATFVCAGMDNQCAHPRGGCCQPVPLPASDTDRNPEITAAAVFAKKQVVVAPSEKLQLFSQQHAVVPLSEYSGAPLSVAALHTFVTFHFHGLHGPPLFSGRAPPRI